MGRKPSPLVGDHNRVGGDVIAMVEIIVGRLMWAALTRQGCQLATMLKTKCDPPSGNVGFQLETHSAESNDIRNKLQHTDKLL